LALISTVERGLAVAHLAISIVLVWLAINIAFVILRMRATHFQNSGSDLRRPGVARRPEAIFLRGRNPTDRTLKMSDLKDFRHN
jgi:hypothetical protein